MSRVRGPNSALTEFLRSQGINANEIRKKHERFRKRGTAADGTIEHTDDQDDDAEDKNINEESDLEYDEEISKIANAAAKKREADYNAEHDGTSICPVCNTRFTITAYSKPAPNSDDKFLCRSCSNNLRPKKTKSTDKSSSKKRKKMAEELLDLKLLTPPSLRDLCITKVADNIESVTELGNLTSTALNKISRILTRNRRLNPKTMQLFLHKNAKSLEFWDCSSIPPETFNLIPTLSPNLERLVLGMCGQLCGENLIRLAEQIPTLVSVHLDGPFLVRKESWMEFFELIGPRLKSFSVSSVYRIDAEVLALMADSCPELEHLSLSTLSQLRDPTPFFMIGTSLKNLRHLEISDLESEAWSDDALVEILQLVGSNLSTLIIKNPKELLSDRVINAISEYCTSLVHLELVNFTDISNESVMKMFKNWINQKRNGNIQFLSLERCINVGDDTIIAAIELCGSSLIELNVNSLRNIGPLTIEKFAALPKLSKLDIGFIGRVNPRQVYKLSTSKSLKQVLAFGNIRISGMPLPTGMALLGTM